MLDSPRAAPIDTTFARRIHRALLDLYDPPQLARSRLLAQFSLDHQPDPPAALRRILLDAVDALKPADTTPPQANAWRTYRILLHRYVQQIPQRDIATSLGFSVRQLQRHEQTALQALVDWLQPRYSLDLPGTASGADPGGAPAAASATDYELERLRSSFASEAISLAEVVQAALRTALPLLESMHVMALPTVSLDLPLVAAQGIPMRQALVSLFTAAARCTPAGSIEIAATAEAGQVRLTVRPVRALASASASPSKPEPLCPDDLDNVAMARQLVTLSGGSLRLEEASDGPFVATLLLPTAGQLAVLAIDDNVDSLHLLQRFLEGTRYPFVGASDPAQALELAQGLSPKVIILDVMLPGMDGWELLGRLREHPATRDIPVAVSTILPHEQLALTLGAAAFLRKPVSRTALLATLDALTQTQTQPPRQRQ